MSSVIVGTILMLAMTATLAATTVAMLHVPGQNCAVMSDGARAGGARVLLHRCERDPCATLGAQYYSRCDVAEPARSESTLAWITRGTSDRNESDNRQRDSDERDDERNVTR